MNFRIILSVLCLTLLFDFALAGGKLYGGCPIDITKAPYMVQIIGIRSNGGGWQCGGSIVLPNLLLTAGHCVLDADTGVINKDFIIHVGETKLQNRTGSQYTVKKVYLHPKYIGEANNWHNDVAMLELDDKINFSKKIQNVKLANKDDKSKPGTKGIVSGWGSNPEHPDDDRLYQLSLTIISSKQCAEEFQDDSIDGIEKHEICAKDDYKNHCQGDSGGPFIDTKTGRQVGIVSYGPLPCTDNRPSVFARVTDNLDFIDQTIEKTLNRGVMVLNSKRNLSFNETSEDS